MPDDIEFLGEGGWRPSDVEETLSAGRSPGRRPWRWWLGLALAAVAVVAAAAVSHHRAGPPDAIAPPVDSGAATASASADAAPDGLVGTGGVGEIDYEALLAGVHLYVVNDHGVQLLDAATRHVLRTHPLGTPDAFDEGPGYQLVLDAGHSILWLLTSGVPPVSAIGLDATTLRPVAKYVFDGLYMGATIYAGRLYLATDRGVYVVSRTTRLGLYMLGRQPVQSVAADPQRRRVLVASGQNAYALTFANDRPTTAARLTDVGKLPFGKGVLAVVDGHIWAAGYGRSGAVLDQLDPQTLRPDLRSKLTWQLGPGVDIATVGDHSLFVRSGAGVGPIWCVNAISGVTDQYWPAVEGTVTAGDGRALVTTDAGIEPMPLQGCHG